MTKDCKRCEYFEENPVKGCDLVTYACDLRQEIIPAMLIDEKCPDSTPDEDIDTSREDEWADDQEDSEIRAASRI